MTNHLFTANHSFDLAPRSHAGGQSTILVDEMRNKPNLRNDQMNTTPYIARRYKNLPLHGGGKNKPKQTQFKPNTNPFLPPKTALKPKTNPIKPNSRGSRHPNPPAELQNSARQKNINTKSINKNQLIK
jgi:hypothetical protein